MLCGFGTASTDRCRAWRRSPSSPPWWSRLIPTRTFSHSRVCHILSPCVPWQRCRTSHTWSCSASFPRTARCVIWRCHSCWSASASTCIARASRSASIVRRDWTTPSHRSQAWPTGLDYPIIRRAEAHARSGRPVRVLPRLMRPGQFLDQNRPLTWVDPLTRYSNRTDFLDDRGGGKGAAPARDVEVAKPRGSGSH